MQQTTGAAGQTIDEQHVAILACADALIAALQSGEAADAVTGIRLKLAGLLQANLALEEAELMGPIRRLAPADRPRLFDEMGDEVADLRRRYSAHVGRWSLREIEKDMGAYARAAQGLISETKAHLDKKRLLLPEWRKSIRPASVA